MNAHAHTCTGCGLLRLAMPGVADDPMDVLAGAVRAGARRLGCAVADLVVVVGAKGLGLPFDDQAVGPFVFGMMRRADVVAWASGDAQREVLVAAASAPPPEGRVWILIAVGSRESGLVSLLNHDLPAPSTRAEVLGELALVPENGGPALGRRVVKGGSA